MSDQLNITKSQMPKRYYPPSLKLSLLLLAALITLVYSFIGAEISLSRLTASGGNMWRVLGDMLPPTTQPAKLKTIGAALLQTFQMAVVGSLLGIILSLPLSILASNRHAPNRLLYNLARTIIAIARTIPDLVWAVFFVATVGLGPFAGALTLMVDTLGFAGRFFAEAMEEVDPGPQEALVALGANRWGVLFCAVFPATLPSFINTALFSLEKATRSSVVLGLVGAGGIGIQLKIAMEFFRYQEALTIVLAILMIVILVEKASAAIRKKLI